jgi:hypothetical protein
VYILVPWKPIVVVWLLLSGMIFAGFVGSSLIQGKDPFAPPATVQQSNVARSATARKGQKNDHTRSAPESASR